MTVSIDPALGEVHLDTAWVARLEGISEHHVRRLARAGHYNGAFRRGSGGRWLIPMSSVTRTLDGLLWHVQERDAARL